MNAQIQQKRESGQVIVLLALGLLALLGLTAVAIDGGMIYADRRYDQNAADAASYAGAGAAAMKMENSNITYNTFKCNSSMQPVKADALDAAIARAASNNFAVDLNMDDQQGVEVTCGIDPIDLGGALFDKHLDVRTMISSDLQTAFAHLFYSGRVRNTVEATTRIRPRSDLTYGYAITALSEDCGEGIDFSGDSTVKVHTTGIFSNSCVKTNGGITVQTIAGTNPGDTQPPLAYVDQLTVDGGGVIDAPKIHTNTMIPRKTVPPPDCHASSMSDQPKPDWGPKDTDLTIDPGRYELIIVNAGNNLHMNPGLYCVSKFFTGNGGVIDSLYADTGQGVTIYLEEDAVMGIAGNVEVHLQAPLGEASPAIRGMLVYAAELNTKNQSLSGGDNSWFTGTLYAPYGSFELGGNGGVNMTFTTQIVANYIKVHGTHDMEINYDAEKTFNQPAYIELYR